MQQSVSRGSFHSLARRNWVFSGVSRWGLPPAIIPELHAYPVVLLREQLFTQSVVLFLFPFPRQEVRDHGAAAQEGAAVAPDGGRGVGLGDPRGRSSVPERLGGFHFLIGGFEGEGGFVLGHGVAGW